MIKNKFIFCIAIFLFIPLIYAGNYSSGNYGKGFYGVGEIIETPIQPIESSSESSSGGGSSSCTYNWQCTNWFPSICPESEVRKRICVNEGDCSGTKGIPNRTQTCEYLGLGPTEPLFDIYLTLLDKNKEMCAGNKIKANIKLENYAKVELLDVFMTYWIVDENNKLIAESKDTRAVEKETNFNIELKIPKSTSAGIYKIYVKIIYSGNKTAVTGESFEVLSKEDCNLVNLKSFKWNWLIYGGVGIILLVFVLILIKIFKTKFRRKKIKKKVRKTKTYKEYKRKIKQDLKKIKSKTFLIVFASFIIAGILFILGKNMTGFVAGNVFNSNNNNLNIFGFVLIFIMCGLGVFIYWKKIIKRIKFKKINKYPQYSLKGLIKKKVYTEDGVYIGKVEEVFLGKNKVDNLKIKLNTLRGTSKKQKFKVKGIIVKYKNVKSVGHIVIIDEKILEKLKI